MSSVHQRIGIAATAIALASLTVPVGLAAAAESDDCVAAGNVWVVVEHDDATIGGCATEFGDGLEALNSAGIPYAADGGFMTTIDGQPQVAGAEDWWSYWSAAPAEDGALAWESYPVGATDARPEAGSVEGWRLAHSFTEDAPPPSIQQLSEAPGATVAEDGSAAEASEEGGGMMALLIGAGVLVLAAAVGVVLWRRRRTA